jgi:hypothetical protein
MNYVCPDQHPEPIETDEQVDDDDMNDEAAPFDVNSPPFHNDGVNESDLTKIFGKYVCDKCPNNPCHFKRVQTQKDLAYMRHIIMNLGCMLNPNAVVIPREMTTKKLDDVDCDALDGE